MGLCAVPVRRKKQTERCARSAEDCQIFYRGRMIAEMGICRRHLRIVMRKPVSVYGTSFRIRRSA